MVANIPEYSVKIASFAGGADLTQFQVARLRAAEGHVFAADGGADALWALGIQPDAIIGDLDSLEDECVWADRGVRVIRVSEQDTTDFSKCLTCVQARLSVCYGFIGGRLDHTLACVTEIGRRSERRIILVGEKDFSFVLPRRIQFDLSKGTLVSLWPLADILVTRTEGLEWSATGLALSPIERIGTSNKARGGPVLIEADGPGLIVTLPLEALDQMISILGG